jgi:hypothetical protein
MKQAAHGVVAQKIKLLIASSVRTSNATFLDTIGF